MINSFKGKHNFLSNFYPASVKMYGDEYATVEHAYQAAKAWKQEDRDKVRNAPTPGIAKRYGRYVELRSDWNDICLEVMENLLRQKFTYHEELYNALLATGNEELQEGNYWGDRFWGTVDGVGENNLGKLLMKIRAEIAIDEVYKATLARMENGSAT